MADAKQNNACCCQYKMKVTDFLCRGVQGKLTDMEKKKALKVTGIVLVVFVSLCLFEYTMKRGGARCGVLPMLAVIVAIGFAGKFCCKVKKALKKKDEEIKDLQNEIKTLNFRIDQQNELFLKEMSRLQKLVNERTGAKSFEKI